MNLNLCFAFAQALSAVWFLDNWFYGMPVLNTPTSNEILHSNFFNPHPSFSIIFGYIRIDQEETKGKFSLADQEGHSADLLSKFYGVFQEFRQNLGFCSTLWEILDPQLVSQAFAVLLHLSCATLWLISTAGLGFRFGIRLGFQTLWLHKIMQHMFPMTWIQIQIPLPNGYCTHFRDRFLSLLHTFQSGDHSLNLNQWKNPAQYGNLSASLKPSPAMEISHYRNLCFLSIRN